MWSSGRIGWPSGCRGCARTRAHRPFTHLRSKEHSRYELCYQPIFVTTTPELVSLSRRLPVGVEPHGESGCHFRVWAADHEQVTLVIEGESGAVLEEVPLASEGDGYFSALAPAARAGTLYRYRLGASTSCFPDPASRAQPFGPHGPSQVVDPNAFVWTDQSWGGISLEGQVLYELHVGTFTPEGTWRAAMDHLQPLVDIGMTTIEMMPVAEFSGRFGWGYDGVDLFAATHLYGTPDDLRRFVDRAHGLGLGVILDVVYNHLGPDGNYLGVYADDYLIPGKGHEWGDVINFDGPNSGPVREFFITNGRYWIEEFHFDGYRFDATHAIRDQSKEYIIGAVGRAAREAADSRSIILVAENDLQEVRMTRPENEGGD